MTDPHAAAPMVVVIEDEPQIRRFLRTALEAEGCHVAEGGGPTKCAECHPKAAAE